MSFVRYTEFLGQCLIDPDTGKVFVHIYIGHCLFKLVGSHDLLVFERHAVINDFHVRSAVYVKGALGKTIGILLGSLFVVTSCCQECLSGLADVVDRVRVISDILKRSIKDPGQLVHHHYSLFWIERINARFELKEPSGTILFINTGIDLQKFTYRLCVINSFDNCHKVCRDRCVIEIIRIERLICIFDQVFLRSLGIPFACSTVVNDLLYLFIDKISLKCDFDRILPILEL